MSVGLQEFEAPRISRLSALQTCRLHPTGVDPRTIVRLEGLCQWKISITPSGFEPTTFRVVVHYLKQLHNRVPQQILIKNGKGKAFPSQARCGPEGG